MIVPSRFSLAAPFHIDDGDTHNRLEGTRQGITGEPERTLATSTSRNGTCASALPPQT
jgi:hypothetical protein